ncbi:hypothetical protein D3C72_1270330 [compost metagenome]
MPGRDQLHRHELGEIGAIFCVACSNMGPVGLCNDQLIVGFRLFIGSFKDDDPARLNASIAVSRSLLQRSAGVGTGGSPLVFEQRYLGHFPGQHVIPEHAHLTIYFFVMVNLQGDVTRFVRFAGSLNFRPKGLEKIQIIRRGHD